MFHALRHSHASALVAGRLDVLTVSRRLGHGSPTVTLTVYAHLFEKTDVAVAAAIDPTLRGALLVRDFCAKCVPILGCQSASFVLTT